MLSVFKFVSCKPEAYRELALRPPRHPRPEKLKKCFTLVVCLLYNNIIVVIGTHFILLVFNNSEGL